MGRAILRITIICDSQRYVRDFDINDMRAEREYFEDCEFEGVDFDYWTRPIDIAVDKLELNRADSSDHMIHGWFRTFCEESDCCPHWITDAERVIVERLDTLHEPYA